MSSHFFPHIQVAAMHLFLLYGCCLSRKWFAWLSGLLRLIYTQILRMKSHPTSLLGEWQMSRNLSTCYLFTPCAPIVLWWTSLMRRREDWERDSKMELVLFCFRCFLPKKNMKNSPLQICLNNMLNFKLRKIKPQQQFRDSNILYLSKKKYWDDNREEDWHTLETSIKH